jgi:hypothetical protein
MADGGGFTLPSSRALGIKGGYSLLREQAEAGFGPTPQQIAAAQTQAAALQQQAMQQSVGLATRFGATLTPEMAAALRARTSVVPAEFMGQFYGQASANEQMRRQQFMQMVMGMAQAAQQQRQQQRQQFMGSLGSLAGMGMQLGMQQGQLGAMGGMGGMAGGGQQAPFGLPPMATMGAAPAASMSDPLAGFNPAARFGAGNITVPLGFGMG